MEDDKEILEMICLEITQRGAQVSILTSAWGLRFTPFLQKNETLVNNLFFNVCYQIADRKNNTRNNA